MAGFAKTDDLKAARTLSVARFAWLLFTVVATGCSATVSPSAGNGETHFLSCREDSYCAARGAGQCRQGRCTIPVTIASSPAFDAGSFDAGSFDAGSKRDAASTPKDAGSQDS